MVSLEIMVTACTDRLQHTLAASATNLSLDGSVNSSLSVVRCHPAHESASSENLVE
jgi:hypothetical protein